MAATTPVMASEAFSLPPAMALERGVDHDQFHGTISLLAAVLGTPFAFQGDIDALPLPHLHETERMGELNSLRRRAMADPR